MEVTFQDENAVSGIVVGGGKKSVFHIATSPEFIKVLSDSIYPNSLLAPVREVICNAWDSHIKSGITDTPIDIEFDGKNLIVRDYGNGIPDDAIEEIYCTYGESTKRESTEETGGFGLGSKAPFAVADSFSVVSRHKGVATTYAILKSDPEEFDLPSATVVVSIPTTEKGVTVKIPFNKSDAYTTINNIHKVIKNGEIKANTTIMDKGELKTQKYEGNELKLKESHYGFILTNYSPDGVTDYRTSLRYSTTFRPINRIFIQYGSVIYPIESHDYYIEEYDQLSKMSEQLPDYTLSGVYSKKDIKSKNLIIKAESNTLSIAPSRESLHYVPITLETIKQKLNNINSILSKPNEQIYQDTVKRIFDDFMVINYNELSDPNFIYKINSGMSSLIFDFYNKYYLDDNDDTVLYTKQDIYEKFVNIIRIRKIKQNLGGNPFINQLFKYYKKHKQYNYIKLLKYGSNHERYTRNWKSKLAENFSGDFVNKHTFLIKRESTTFTFLTRVSGRYHGILYYKPNTILLSQNRAAIKSYLSYVESNSRTHIGNCIIVPKSTKKYNLDDVAQVLLDQGLEVIRVDQMVEHQPVRKTGPKEAVVKVEGFPLLSSYMTTSNTNITNPLLDRTTTPDAVTHIKIERYRKILDIFPERSSGYIKLVYKLFPNTVVVSSKKSAENFSKKHSVPVLVDAVNNLIKNLLVTEKFKLYYSIFSSHISKGDDIRWFSLLGNMPNIDVKFKLFEDFTNSFDEKEKIIFDYIIKNDSPYQIAHFANLRSLWDSGHKIREQYLLKNKKLIEEVNKRFKFVDRILISDYENYKDEDKKEVQEFVSKLLKGL